jgi:hypothetical protein
MEKIEVKNEELDAEFNDTLNALAQQGLDLGKVPGGKQGQKRLAQSVAMESANRVLSRHALDTLKAVATGEYKPKPKEEVEEKPKDESSEIKEKPKAVKKTKKAESASKSKKESGASSTKKRPAKKTSAKKPAAKK